MEVVQMGQIKTHGGEVVTGMIVEASIDELHAAGNLLYRNVKVIPLENEDGNQADCPAS